MLSAICFNLDQSKILSSGNGLTDYDWIENAVHVLETFQAISVVSSGLTLYQTTKFLDVPQTESICRQQIKCC